MAGHGPLPPRMPRDWWLRHPAYRRYMLREATVLPLLFALGCLYAGLVALVRGPEPWEAWLAFMARPWVAALNGLALVAALYHAATFYALAPRVMPLAPAPLMVLGQWLGTLAAALVVLAWLYLGAAT